MVFLDIQLEGRSAFEILDKVDSKFDLIFITAYDKYARAFEINALDYLLKPVRKERFKVTIKRYIKHEKTSKPFIEKLEINDRFLVQKSNHLVFVKICDILAIEADNDYSIVYTNDNKKSLVPKTIREWEQILPEKYFLRIHRGTVINLEKIERIEKWHSNTLKVYIKNKSVPVYVSQRYASDIKRKFKL